MSKPNTELLSAMTAASIEARKLANAGKLGELLASIASFLPAVLEDVPPNRLEVALKSIETFQKGDVPAEMQTAVESFTRWVRDEMTSYRMHGIG
jgi:hypothetical protein